MSSARAHRPPSVAARMAAVYACTVGAMGEEEGAARICPGRQAAQGTGGHLSACVCARVCLCARACLRVCLCACMCVSERARVRVRVPVCMHDQR